MPAGYLMEMVKPERHPWPYGPQWNYYPHHVLGLPKIPLPNGPQINSEYNENYLGIRCPEPRRPYQMAGSTFGSYLHQETHSVGSYIQSAPLYPPKPYVHRPIPHENFNNSYKFNESIHSYPTYSNNYSSTKDQSSCYQNSWNNTSQYQRKPPELDVRRFLATWQEKDDDFVELSSGVEEPKVCQSYDSASLPLDCTKRNTPEKSIKRNYENFVSGQSSNTTGCVVQPYCIKDNSTPLNRSIISSAEMNNNIPQRNNLNYGNENSQSYHNKNFYASSDYWKSSSDKFMSCDHHNFSYPQPLNHCDINVNHLRSNLGYRKPKDSLLETSERSQYNLSSSLESGDLFCDINSRNDEPHKQPIIHPLFSEPSHHRGLSCEEQPYFGHENNDFSENLAYTDLHTMKDSWELFPQSLKCKENVKVPEKPKPATCKLTPHTNYQQPSNNSHNTSSSSIMYEGAFNILPNLNDTNLPVNTISNTVQYNTTNSNMVSSNSSPINKSPVIAHPQPLPLSTNKISPNVTKCLQTNSKIKPYQFSEEISSDDIDISIASSGDLVVEEEHSALVAPISVINFSRTKKDKVMKSPIEMSKECNEVVKAPIEYPLPLFPEKTEKQMMDIEENKIISTAIIEPIPCEMKDVKLESFTELPQSNETPQDSLVKTEQSLKPSVMDLTVLKPQNLGEGISLTQKEDTDYLDLSSNYFGQSDFVESTKAVDICAKEEKQTLPEQESCVINQDKTPISYNENIISSLSPHIEKVSEPVVSLPKNDDNINCVPPDENIPLIGLTPPHAVENNLLASPKNESVLTAVDSELNMDADKHLESQKGLTCPTTSKTPVKKKEDDSIGFSEDNNNFSTNDNLLLLAHCSQTYGSQITDETESNEKILNGKSKSSDDSEKIVRPVRDTVIKCSIRWDKIFNVMSDEDTVQPDMSLDLGPAKVELRMPPESCTSGQWKIVEADNKVQTSSIVQVKRLILKRKSQSEERIPKMVIKKTDGEKYRSYLKKEPNEAVLNCGKFKIYYDIPSKSKFQRNIEDGEPSQHMHTCGDVKSDPWSQEFQ